LGRLHGLGAVGRSGIVGTACPLRAPSYLVQTTTRLRRFHPCGHNCRHG
jgi:hypothetical protein